MKITKSELKNRYGIVLDNGKYDIEIIGDKYSISTVRDDTDGCVLVGRNCHTTSDTQTISGSALAYTRLYEKVYKAIQKGETVSIRVS